MEKSKTLYVLGASFVIATIMCGFDTAAESFPTTTTEPHEIWGKGSVHQTLPKGDFQKIKSIIDGDTVVLTNHQQVRLVGIQAPKLPLGRKNFPNWPLAQESADLLRQLANGQAVTLHYGQTRMDRHGRLLAHLVRHDGVWLQGTMLRAGLARVYSFPDNTALVPQMLTIERKARRAKRRVWGLSQYLVRDAAQATWPRGTGFELVRGVVKSVKNVRGTFFLNFGADWKSDFTIRIPTKWRHRFLEAGIDPLTYSGKKVVVRGWVRQRNGWMITATHPEQIELN